MNNQQTEQWAIIELMGHQKIAGRYSEHGPMHRVDVPNVVNGGFRFTRLYSPQAIYSITFVDQEAAITAARIFDSPAITIWKLQHEIKRLAASVTVDTIDLMPRCLNCGEVIVEDGDFCSPDCQFEYQEYRANGEIGI